MSHQDQATIIVAVAMVIIFAAGFAIDRLVGAPSTKEPEEQDTGPMKYEIAIVEIADDPRSYILCIPDDNEQTQIIGRVTAYDMEAMQTLINNANTNLENQ